MTIQIKVRCWHFKMKKMFSCEKLVADQMAMLADGRFAEISKDDTRLSNIISRDVMLPLQYIGQRDKTEVEIWEGDIGKDPQPNAR